MKKYTDTVQAPLSGSNVLQPVSGATITVNVHGDGAATIYSDDGITVTTNPTTTDVNGRFAFYAADGRYDLIVAGPGLATFTLSDIEIADVTQSSTTDVNWNIGGVNTPVFFVQPTTTGDNFVYLTNNAGAAGKPNSTTFSSGMGYAWNTSGGGGESDFYNHFGGGNQAFGAYRFFTWNGTTATEIASLPLIGPSSGNNVTLLNVQGPLGPVTGNAADQALFSYTLPANTVATAKAIRVTVGVGHTTGTASVTYKLKLNNILQDSFTSAATGAVTLTGTIVAVSSTSASIVDLWMSGAGVGQQGSGGAVGGVAWTSNQILEFDFNVANTDAVTPRQWLVELIQ